MRQIKSFLFFEGFFLFLFFNLLSCGGGGGGGGTTLNINAAMITSSAGPWGQLDVYQDGMDEVFGSGNWDLLDIATEDGSAFATDSPYDFIYLEGSAEAGPAIVAYLAAHISQIETWVANGGRLYINAATYDSIGTVNAPFGVTIDYHETEDVSAVNPTHPIFNGPFTPVGTTYMGGLFAHNRIVGTGLTHIILDADDATRFCLASAAQGSGFIVYGGITSDNFHDPQPNAHNLYMNILRWAASGGGGGTAQLKIFVTSEAGSGNLQSWAAYAASGSSATGLGAADAICQYLATQAGLSGTFRAWLSDQNTDAYCHIHGLTGKKVSNCEGTLPTPYGPWVRMDGFPFGETIDVITSIFQIYAPVLFNEEEIAADEYFTDTYPSGGKVTSGDPAYNSCDNWSSSSGSYTAAVGNPVLTTVGWTFYGIVQCSDNRRLLCVQAGTGPALPSHTTTGKIAFVTSTPHNGNLGGLAGADAVCQARAAASPISAVNANASKFKAWLSDSTTNAIDRFIYNGPWVRIDGVKIADNKADLTDGALFSSINQTEFGDYEGNTWVWTGTLQSGNRMGGDTNCNNWTDDSDSYNGNGGLAFSVSSTWTNNFGADCNASYTRLYCFEDE